MTNINKIMDNFFVNLVKEEMSSMGFTNIHVTPWGYNLEDDWESWEAWVYAKGLPETGHWYENVVQIAPFDGQYDINYTGPCGICCYL